MSLNPYVYLDFIVSFITCDSILIYLFSLPSHFILFSFLVLSDILSALLAFRLPLNQRIGKLLFRTKYYIFYFMNQFVSETTALFSFASLSRIENIPCISNTHSLEVYHPAGVIYTNEIVFYTNEFVIIHYRLK